MRLLLLITVAAVFATVAVMVSTRSTKAQAERPFTMTEVTHYYAPNGRDTTTETTIFGVRSDGSWFRDFTRQFDSGDGKKWTVNFRKFADYSKGLRVSLYPALQAVTTSPAERPASSAPACTEGSAGGAVLGYPVQLVTKVLKMRDRSVERNLWIAPDLGCRVLRLNTTVTMSDGQSGGASTMEVASISLGEPSPAYFLVPLGWAERSPSEVNSAAATLTNAPVCPGCDETGTVLDNVYRSSRTKAGWK